MNKKQTIKLGLFLILVFGFLFFKSISNDYMHYKIRKCFVLDKLERIGRNSGNFYLILKEEREIVFDLIVSPATYSQARVGDTLNFNLREFDIKQTSQKNLFYFFSPIILGVILILIIILTSVEFFIKNKLIYF